MLPLIKRSWFSIRSYSCKNKWKKVWQWKR